MNFTMPSQGPADYARPVHLAIGARLRKLRKEKGLTQQDITRKAGLMRCYISRVENGYKAPSLKTLERFALALDVPLYKLFYDGDQPLPPAPPSARSRFESLLDLNLENERSSHKRFLRELGSLWFRIGDFEHQILLGVATRLASRPEGPAEGNAGRTLELPTGRRGRKCLDQRDHQTQWQSQA